MSMKKIGYYDILFFDEASGDVTFLVMKWIFLVEILEMLNLITLIFLRMIQKLLLIIKLCAWYNRLKQSKAFKKEISK